MKWLEENMKYSFAVQKYVWESFYHCSFKHGRSSKIEDYDYFDSTNFRSEEVCCGICLDKIRLNPDSKDKRFGILRTSVFGILKIIHKCQWWSIMGPIISAISMNPLKKFPRVF